MGSMDAELAAQLNRMTAELDRRTIRHNVTKAYARRMSDMPTPHYAVERRVTTAYRRYMGMSAVAWGKLIIASKLDRLEATGIDTGDESVDQRVWRDVWQSNAMDLEFKLAGRAALRDGRAHALVWPSAETGLPEVSIDDATQMIVEFREGSRRHRTGAMRRWCDDDDRGFATLYRPDGLYKFRKRVGTEQQVVKGCDWVRREVDGEEWPLPNPWKVVPVVELGVNRDLAPGRFTECRGEYEDEIGLMDRINFLMFQSLVVANAMGFPLRGVIGDQIDYDDDGKPIAPFDVLADGIFQLENPQAKIVEYSAADRANLAVFDDLAQLAANTSTPRHYFPVDGAIGNVAESTIRAFEGPMHATVNGTHKPSLGEGCEEVCRLGGLMSPEPLIVPAYASLVWADHESRSLAERADSFVKLSGENGLPWVAAAEIALNLTQEQIRRYAAENAGDALSKLIAAAADAPASPAEGAPSLAEAA